MTDFDKVNSLRQGAEAVRPQPPPHRFGTVVAMMLGIGFIALFLYVNRDNLIPAEQVTVTSALVTKADQAEVGAQAAPEQALFQAAGWVEPRPYAVKATAFVTGIIRQVYVLDGDPVKKGQKLAEIDDRELKLELATAQAEAEAMATEIAVSLAKINPLEAEITLLKAKKETAKAELARLRRTAELLAGGGDNVRKIEREDAALAAARQEISLAEIDGDMAVQAAEQLPLQAEAESARRRLETQRQKIARIQLDLERTVIVAPIDGVVQKLYTAPGAKVMMVGDNMDSATIVSLYEPGMLQVRVDVALADAGGLATGMKTRIQLDVLPDVKLTGVVTSIVGSADIQKNTLQAKVAIDNPPRQLRPDMLARVEFQARPLATEGTPATGAGNAASPIRCYVPKAALHNLKDKDAELWIATPKGTAERRTVKLGQHVREDWQEVLSEVNPGELVITSDPTTLKPGKRIKTTAGTRH
jgi:RND family efflux transporter MFP subunit